MSISILRCPPPAGVELLWLNKAEDEHKAKGELDKHNQLGVNTAIEPIHSTFKEGSKSMTFVKKQAIPFPLTLLAFSGLTWAQGLASLRGTVADSSGAVIPVAPVSLTQSGRGFSRTVESNAQGDYLIPSLQPADYVLTVQAKGFQKFVQAGITLLADQSATVNVAESAKYRVSGSGR